MNEISLIYKFLIEHFKNDLLVNTITILPTLEMDFNKENIYPLVNLDLKETSPAYDNIEAQFTITILQQRDVNAKKIDNKLLTNTNYVDNLNETHSIGMKLINRLEKQNNDENVEVSTYTNFRILKDYGMSGLDGVQFDIDLVVENLGSGC
jgi:hypothetical protein